MSKKLASPRAEQKIQRVVKNALRSKVESYESFDIIDGRHPWQQSVPDGFVPYPVKKLGKGKVVFFNYSLAREMGLISSSHPNQMTPQLVEKLIETFSVQIVNEYDQANGITPPKESMKQHPYMATRYLQLQHSNKQGKTSGDGRSIWNGVVQYRGMTWDVSSRGTGVTCLSPGAAEANKPLKTGATDFGYGCGLADTTELLGSALMSEIFHLNGLSTERVLTIIDLGKGCGIGVRAAPNLIRPAHLFLYLKQGRLDCLKQSVDYLIDRQYQNGEWNFSTRSPERYKKMLANISESFAKYVARLEREYIFAWLDWDGDNFLANGGIIDYGSIRQFGLRHDQYRYDDVQRFSTTLNEQRGKARGLVQVFAQLVQFLETGKREAIESFENHPSVRDYDRTFDRELRRIFLVQCGLTDDQAELLMKKKAGEVEKFYHAFLALEKMKTKAAVKKLPDGVNRPAIFNMRALLKNCSEAVVENWKSKKKVELPEVPKLLEFMTSSFAKRGDLKLRPSLREKIEAFSAAYVRVIQNFATEDEGTVQLRAINQRSQERNRAGRLTGNGAEFVVDALIRARRRGVSPENIQAALDLFVASQAPKSSLSGRKTQAASADSEVGALFRELDQIAHDFQEDI